MACDAVYASDKRLPTRPLRSAASSATSRRVTRALAAAIATAVIAGSALTGCGSGGQESFDVEAIAAADQVLAELALQEQEARRQELEAAAELERENARKAEQAGLGESDETIYGNESLELLDANQSETFDPWWWLDSPPSSDAAISITGVSVERHDGFDRVVLDLAGTGVPGWVVEKVDTPVDDGSGLPVKVSGSQFLLLRLAGIEFPTYAAEPSIAPTSVRANGRSVQEVVKRFWFEGNTNIFIGLRFAGEPHFEVGLLHDPLALFVDITHP